MFILNVSNLTKIFTSGTWPFKKHKQTVVHDISFDLNKGEILGLLGPNGAGKTTTIQMLLGILKPTSGSIIYFGSDFTKNPVEVLKKIGYASGYERLPSRLTVQENLDIVGRIYSMTKTDRLQQIEKLLKFFGIWSMRDYDMGVLSAGQATRVMLVKAFMPDPDIVLLDEPTASLDPDIAQEVRQFILMQKQQRNVSMLITSHNMDEVTELCDRVCILKKGEVIANNTPEELAASISKVRVYVTISQGLGNVLKYLQLKELVYVSQDNYLKIEIDEDAIAQFLADISEQKIMYSHISINKPSLEDYFLSIAR